MSTTEHVCDDCGDDFPHAGALGSHRYYKHDSPADRVDVECPVCGTTDDILESQRQDQYEHWFCSMDCRDEHMRQAFRGDGNPRYEDRAVGLDCDHCGSSFERFESQYIGDHVFCHWDCYAAHKTENADEPNQYGTEWQKLRKHIRQRDGVCLSCGAEPTDRNHDVHHIIPVREFDETKDAHFPVNLVTLCRACHVKVEHDLIDCPTSPVGAGGVDYETYP